MGPAASQQHQNATILQPGCGILIALANKRPHIHLTLQCFAEACGSSQLASRASACAGGWPRMIQWRSSRYFSTARSHCRSAEAQAASYGAKALHFLGTAGPPGLLAPHNPAPLVRSPACRQSSSRRHGWGCKLAPAIGWATGKCTTADPTESPCFQERQTEALHQNGAGADKLW